MSDGDVSRVLLANGWLIFFFSSRRRHTRFSRDWSSDVCSSDLHARRHAHQPPARPLWHRRAARVLFTRGIGAHRSPRSEERRVGKSVDLGGRRIIEKKKTTQT